MDIEKEAKKYIELQLKVLEKFREYVEAGRMGEQFIINNNHLSFVDKNGSIHKVLTRFTIEDLLFMMNKEEESIK